VRPVWG